MRLQIRPGESLLLKTFADDVDAEAWRYVESKGTPVVLAEGWTLTFPESAPAVADTFAIGKPVDWTTLDDPRLQVNAATGRYAVEFTLPEGVNPSDWELSLGNLRESARVRVNGKEAGTVWSVPYVINIGHLLKPGVNTMEIDVTNLQANRIRDYEKRGVEWRKFKDANINSVTGARQFSFGDWPVTPSGLTTEVTLTPVFH